MFPRPSNDGAGAGGIVIFDHIDAKDAIKIRNYFKQGRCITCGIPLVRIDGRIGIAHHFKDRAQRFGGIEIIVERIGHALLRSCGKLLQRPVVASAG